MYVHVCVCVCMCVWGKRESKSPAIFVAKEVHRLGIGFVFERCSVYVHVKKEGMERKLEWVYDRQVGEVS